MNMKKYFTSLCKTTGLKTIFLVLIVSFLVIACGNAENSTKNSTQNLAKIEHIVQSREFEIKNEWLRPLNGSQINLIGNDNFIRFKGDSIKIFLPYYGERHAGGMYSGEGGIKYEGPAKSVNTSKNKKKAKLELTFEVQQSTENLNFFIEIYSSGKVYTNVNSSQRAAISYEGTLSKTSR